MDILMTVFEAAALAAIVCAVLSMLAFDACEAFMQAARSRKLAAAPEMPKPAQAYPMATRVTGHEISFPPLAKAA